MSTDILLRIALGLMAAEALVIIAAPEFVKRMITEAPAGALRIAAAAELVLAALLAALAIAGSS